MATMSASALGAFIQHESDAHTAPRPLDKAMIHDANAASPSDVELDTLQWGQKLNGPHELAPAGYSIPPTPGELEQSRPATPTDHVVDALAAASPYTTRNKWRLAAAGIVFLFSGMNDAVTGAVLPSIEAQYHVSYSIVSLLFIANALGFISSAPVISTLDAKLGRSRLLMLACSCMTVGFTTLTCAPPFPVIVVAFFFSGTGMSLFLAVSNAFIANLMNGTVILGFMHGLYGVGGIVSPLIATAMISKGIRWSYFYIIPLTLAAVSIAFMGWSYRGFEADAAVQLMTALERTASRRTMPGEPTKRQQLWTSLKSRTTLLGALFIFFYQGSEVAISGWVISYLIHYRDGDPSQVGNVTSGFWGGITRGSHLPGALEPSILT
jgi:fucose permease